MAPDGWQVVEFPTGAVLPGLIDMHVHLCGDAGMGALDRLAYYTDTELDEVITASLRLQLAAGVTTVRDLSGTDAGIRVGKPHGVLPGAIADFVAGGMSATAALASATSVAAESAGLRRRKGRLQPGFDADVLVVDGDQIADIAAPPTSSTRSAGAASKRTESGCS